MLSCSLHRKEIEMKRAIFRKYIDGIVFWVFTYPFGVLLGILLYLLKFFGILTIKHPERLPLGQKKVILVSNHPSLWEPILLVPLFFRHYLFHPRQAPWSTPDKGNYFDKWYWFFARPRLIPVPRGERRPEVHSLVKIVRVLRHGDAVIFFPEGGRTFKGKEFLYSKNGRRIRPLRNGIGDILTKVDALVVPVWVEGTEDVLPNNGAWFPRLWKRHSITIGMPVRYNGVQYDRKEITRCIGEALLGSADEE